MSRRPALQTRVINTILATFGGLTIVMALLLGAVMSEGLKGDLEKQARVLGKALESSAEVSAGARARDRALLERGLDWIAPSVGDALVAVLVLAPDGGPIAGVDRAGALNVDTLVRVSARKAGFAEAAVEVPLAVQEDEGAADDAMAQIEREERAAAAQPKAPAAPAKIRVILSGRAQVVRQVVVVIIVGLVLAAMALITLIALARDTFRRVEPALGQAKSMAQGDFTQKLSADYLEIATLFDALNGISSSLSSMIGDARGLGDEVNGAVDRIRGAATALRSGAAQGTRAVELTEGAVATTVRSVDDSTRKLAALATTADVSLRDTETIERTNAQTGAAVQVLRGEVERQQRSIGVIGARAKDLSSNARSLAQSGEVARAAATRQLRSSTEGVARAQEAARLADGALRDTQAGGKAIEDAVARIRDIAKLAHSMEQNLRVLTDRVEGMKPVLSAIAEVTSRTSLLALNAGIIAAQAGERGAAFQVVVDELKSLAAKTAQLTGTVEESVRTVLLQRGKADEAAEALSQLLGTSIEDARSAAEALQAIRASTAESQSVSGAIAESLAGQERDAKETLARVDVVEQAGKSTEATARALSDEVRVLTEVADRVTAVTDEVMKASREQGELAQRVGGVLTNVARQVRELSASQASQQADVTRVESSLQEIRRFADDARVGAVELETVVEPVSHKASQLSNALHRFRTRTHV
jgi:methyl-accepting chemotaxis protein